MAVLKLLTEARNTLLKIKLSKMRIRIFSFHCENNILKNKYDGISNWRSYMFSKFDVFVAVHHTTTLNSLNNHYLLQALLVQLNCTLQ